MKKILSITATFIVLILFVSCDKTKLGDPLSCIDPGNTDYKIGKNIYLMNCSQNFSYSDWKVYDSSNVEIYTSPSDTMRHLAYTFPYVGRYKVSLKVWFSDTLVNSTSELELTTIAP
jgi:hypothetical protein